MKAEELRIGNLVHQRFEQRSPSGFNYVYSVREVNVAGLERCLKGISDYEPIPLTEEWFVKFGFISCKSSNEEDKVIDYWKNILYFDRVKDLIRINGVEIYTEIDYVHQLQNLYFALTGEELTIKTN